MENPRCTNVHNDTVEFLLNMAFHVQYNVLEPLQALFSAWLHMVCAFISHLYLIV